MSDSIPAASTAVAVAPSAPAAGPTTTTTQPNSLGAQMGFFEGFVFVGGHPMTNKLCLMGLFGAMLGFFFMSLFAVLYMKYLTSIEEYTLRKREEAQW